jgi:hypothetical protein
LKAGLGFRGGLGIFAHGFFDPFRFKP